MSWSKLRKLKKTQNNISRSFFFEKNISRSYKKKIYNQESNGKYGCK